MTVPYMDSLTYFTVSGDFKAVVEDARFDPDYDPEVDPITATVVFTPLLRSGDVILAVDANPPTSFVPVPIAAIIDSDGRLKLRGEPDEGSPLDFVPVRLLADQKKLGLRDPLFYRVEFTNVRFAGRSGSIKAFTFQAPNADVDLNLVTVMPQPGSVASGVNRIAPSAVRLDDDGRIQFSFGGVDIPDALPIEVVNAQGPQGEPGPAGPQGPQGVPGIQGVQGEAGVSLDIEGTVATYQDLPVSPKPGAAYVVAADGRLYFWDGVSWPADGEGVAFRGPAGPQGVPGPQGLPGTTDWAGIANKPTDLVTLAGSQTLTNKTLTAPVLVNPKTGLLRDPNYDRVALSINPAQPDPTNYLEIRPNTGYPQLRAMGASTNLDLMLYGKGTGGVRVCADNGSTTPFLMGENGTANSDFNLRSVGTGKVLANGSEVVTAATGSRFVCKTSRATSTANQWTKVADFAIGSPYYAVTVCLSVTESFGRNDSAVVVVSVIGVPSGNNLAYVNIVAKSGSGGAIAPDSFKVVTGAAGTNAALWIKDGWGASEFRIHELSRAEYYGTVSYVANSPWQTEVPTGPVEAVSAGVTAFGVPVVTTTGAQTLTNKSLTAPTITDPRVETIRDNSGAGYIAAVPAGNIVYVSPNGRSAFEVAALAGTVNNIRVTGAGATGTPTISAGGTDANVSLSLVAKGTGTVKANGVDVVTTTGTQTLTGKTISGANNTITAIPQTSITGLTTSLAGKVSGEGLSLWTGTQAQYDAIATKSDTTVYVIT